MKLNTFSLSTSLAILLSIGVVFAADDYEHSTNSIVTLISTGFASEVKPATFKTYTEITKELGDTKPTLQECYDLYNPVRIINDIYVELDQFEKRKIPAKTLKNLFLKWIFAQ